MKKKYLKVVSLIVVSVLALCLFASCDKAIYVTGIEMHESKKTILSGDSEIVIANVLPHNASNDALTWSSSNENVVIVRDGVLTAMQVGRAVVTATTNEGGFSKSVEIEVLKNQFEVSPEFDKNTEGYGINKFSKITDAVATADVGEEILVLKGEYDEIVPITKKLKLLGQDAHIKGYFIVGYPMLEKYVNEVIIDGFNFTCEKATSFEEPACIYIGIETRDLVISNCTFNGADQNSLAIRNIEGAQASAVMNPKIVKCEFNNFKNAINFCQYVIKSEISDNTFNNCEYGVFLQGGKQAKIVGNNFVDSGMMKTQYANMPTSKIIFKQNNITQSKNRENTTKKILCVRDGDIKPHEKIDLRGNMINGVKIENLTDAELQHFKKSIDVSNPTNNVFDFDKIIFR